MRPCTATNKIACASSDECRGRVLRGSDRSADSGLAPNLFEYVRERYGRPSQSPGERPIMLHLRAEIRQSCAGVKPRNVRGRCPKSTHSRTTVPYRLRAPKAALWFRG